MMAGGESHRAPAARLCPRLSGCAGTCTAALEETLAESRELAGIRLLRLRTWQLYRSFFPLNCKERQLEGVNSNVFK